VKVNKYGFEKHPALKIYYPLVLLFFILLIFGRMNIFSNGFSYLPKSNAEVDTIENFDDGVIQLQSYSNQDINPTMWLLENTITYNNSLHSLKLYGNTWKLEVISPITIDSGDVWQVSNYIQQVAEIQGFGITDSINTLLYSFAGTEEVNPEEWITVYQGAFPNNVWNDYQLPIADDWLARFGYLPVVKGIVFINDRDNTSTGISYFDEIIDMTGSLPHHKLKLLFQSVNSIETVMVSQVWMLNSLAMFTILTAECMIIFGILVTIPQVQNPIHLTPLLSKMITIILFY
jgi:hypothetical protein